MPLRLTATDPNFELEFSEYVNRRRDVASDVADVVTQIISGVRTRQDAALLEYTKKFDRLELVSGSQLRLTGDEIDKAAGAARKDVIAALERASARIETFHEQQIPEGFDYTDQQGVRLGARWTPLGAVGIYVPGGTAAYPSSVLMNAIPAKVAGVERIVMAVPTPEGQISPLVFAAARMAGVDEIYRIGGAQAIAAFAYGTETVAPVDKITGPGNSYVAEAKRQVFGRVGIDMVAGPSEILVVADSENDPSWVAADLLSQAEHDRSSQSVLITDSGALADAVADAVQKYLSMLPRGDIAQESWERHGAIVLVRDIRDAVPLINRIAPEHLELALEAPNTLVDRVTNAGAIFLGRYTPEAIGDYVGGPNHILPTAGSARFASGLSTADFMKRTTYVGCDEFAFDRIGPDAVTLAEAEAMDAHALSLSLRLNRP